jgi:hypothetical protein
MTRFTRQSLRLGLVGVLGSTPGSPAGGSSPKRGYRAWEPGRWRHGRRGWFWVEGRSR